VEADPGALGAVSGEGPDAGASEASGVVAIGAAEDHVAPLTYTSENDFHRVPVEWMIDRGYFEEKLSRDHSCVLGRRAVSETHECLGEKCAAWRWGPDCVDTNRRFGFCGLAVRP
jgi:hypothetical protein